MVDAGSWREGGEKQDTVNRIFLSSLGMTHVADTPVNRPISPWQRAHMFSTPRFHIKGQQSPHPWLCSPVSVACNQSQVTNTKWHCPDIHEAQVSYCKPYSVTSLQAPSYPSLGTWIVPLSSVSVTACLVVTQVFLLSAHKLTDVNSTAVLVLSNSDLF